MPPQTAPKVFVLILSWNGLKWLVDCVPSVLGMSYPNFEVAVIDNGSNDGTSEYLRREFPRVHIVETGKNLGYACGFNAGLEYAALQAAEYFLVMNNDTVIDQSALSALVETAATVDRAAFVTGKVYYYDKPDTLQTVGKRGHPIHLNDAHIGMGEKDNGQYEQVAEREFADDVFTLVSRRMYDEVGGYDPQFFLQAEELDWQLRAKKVGWRIYYTPGAKLWHRESASTGGPNSPLVVYFWERSRMVALAKHTALGPFVRWYLRDGYQVVRGVLGGAARLNRGLFVRRLARLLGFLAGSWWLLRRRPATRIPAFIIQLSARGSSPPARAFSTSSSGARLS